MEALNPIIKKIDITLDITTAETRCDAILKTVRPGWNLQDVKTKVFTEGLVNKMFCCYVGDSACEDGIVIRVYGAKTNVIINRDKEFAAMQVFHAAGCSTPVYAVFNNGVVYGYAVGRTLDISEQLKPKFIKHIARLMAKFHSLELNKLTIYDRNLKVMQLPKEMEMFSYMRQLIQHIPESIQNEELNVRYQKYKLKNEFYNTELDNLESYFQNLDLPIVFCHNDLHIQNIVYDDKTDRMRVIDLEFCDLNFEHFDFNCFLEPHILLAWGLMTEEDPPITSDVKYAYAKSYLEAKYELQGQDISTITDQKVQQYLEIIEKTNGLAIFYSLVIAFVFSGHPDQDIPFNLDTVIGLQDAYLDIRESLLQPLQHS